MPNLILFFNYNYGSGSGSGSCPWGNFCLFLTENFIFGIPLIVIISIGFTKNVKFIKQSKTVSVVPKNAIFFLCKNKTDLQCQ